MNKVSVCSPMTQVRSYKDLIVWQKSMDLVDAIYDATNTFPSSRQYGLVSQMQRAAVSIVSNIAEDSRRPTRQDQMRFFVIAYSSLNYLLHIVEILVVPYCYLTQNNY